MTVENALGTCIFQGDSRALYRLDERLIEVLTLPSEAAAVSACERRTTVANNVSLHADVFLQPVELRRHGAQVIVSYDVGEGVLLPTYVREYFADYMADEDFALDLTFSIVDALRTAREPLVCAADDVWLGDDGRVRILIRGDTTTQRESIRGVGELLFNLLTREEAVRMPDRVAFAHDVNGEISASAEGVIRRCVQGVDNGGYGSLASLRQSVLELLRSREKSPTSGRLIDFHRHRVRLEYRPALKSSVAAEERYLRTLRERVIPPPVERWLRRIFSDPEKQGLRPLYWPLLIGWLAIVAPFLLAGWTLQSTAEMVSVVTFLYFGVFAGVYASYRRRPHGLE